MRWSTAAHLLSTNCILCWILPTTSFCVLFSWGFICWLSQISSHTHSLTTIWYALNIEHSLLGFRDSKTAFRMIPSDSICLYALFPVNVNTKIEFNNSPTPVRFLLHNRILYNVRPNTTANLTYFKTSVIGSTVSVTHQYWICNPSKRALLFKGTVYTRRPTPKIWISISSFKLILIII
jgi:hypothetical protein